MEFSTAKFHHYDDAFEKFKLLATHVEALADYAYVGKYITNFGSWFDARHRIIQAVTKEHLKDGSKAGKLETFTVLLDAESYLALQPHLNLTPDAESAFVLELIRFAKCVHLETSILADHMDVDLVRVQVANSPFYFIDTPDALLAQITQFEYRLAQLNLNKVLTVAHSSAMPGPARVLKKYLERGALDDDDFYDVMAVSKGPALVQLRNAFVNLFEVKARMWQALKKAEEMEHYDGKLEKALSSLARAQAYSDGSCACC